MSTRERSRGRGLAPVVLLGASLLASGCAQNALFELYVELPPPTTIDGGTTTANFARVLALPVVADRMTTFDGSRSRVVPLRAGTPQWLGVTFVREGGSVGSPMTVRILYCATEEDCDPVQPERWLGSEDLVFERAAYVAQTTCYAHSLPDDPSDGLTLPSTQRMVSACEVAGCTDDDFTEETADFCRLGTTQHFCAASQHGDVCDRLYADMQAMLATSL